MYLISHVLVVMWEFNNYFRNAMFTIEKERAATDKAFQKQKKGEELIARERDVARKDLQKANGLMIIK